MRTILFVIIVGLIANIAYNKTRDWGWWEDKPELKKEHKVLMWEGWTPATITLDYAFEVETQGKPIDAKFPGVNGVVHYSGTGEFTVPERNFGNVRITASPDSANDQVYVKAYKVSYE